MSRQQSAQVDLSGRHYCRRSGPIFPINPASIGLTSIRVAWHSIVSFGIHKAEISPQKNAEFQFNRRSHCHLEKALKFTIPSAATAFGDVGRDGGTRALICATCPKISDFAKFVVIP
jgi:hypothetical protein